MLHLSAVFHLDRRIIFRGRIIRKQIAYERILIVVDRLCLIEKNSVERIDEEIRLAETKRRASGESAQGKGILKEITWRSIQCIAERKQGIQTGNGTASFKITDKLGAYAYFFC